MWVQYIATSFPKRANRSLHPQQKEGRAPNGTRPYMHYKQALQQLLPAANGHIGLSGKLLPGAALGLVQNAQGMVPRALQGTDVVDRIFRAPGQLLRSAQHV